MKTAAFLLALLAPVALLGAGPAASPSTCAKDPRACERESNLRRPADYGKALGGVKTPERRTSPRPRVVVIVVPGSSVGADLGSSTPEGSAGVDEDASVPEETTEDEPGQEP